MVGQEKKALKNDGRTRQDEESRESIVVYMSRFHKLLDYRPKPLRDQLILELPILQGFRNGEVTTLRAKHVDLENGDIEILDSKKHRFYTRPLVPIVALHLSQYMAETGKKDEDLLICPLPWANRKKRKPGNKTRGEGLSEAQVTQVWLKYCQLCQIPPMAPRMGRAYFAADLAFIKKISVFYIKVAMRHDYVETTIHYLERIVNYEDFKAAILSGEQSPFSPHCQRAVINGCPNQCSEPPCYCRFFTPTVKVETVSVV